MSHTNYLPAGDSERVAWLNNLAIKIGGYQNTLGLSAGDVAQVTKDNALYAYTINLLNIIKQSQQNVTAYKELLKHATKNQVIGAVPTMPVVPVAPAAAAAGIFDRTRALVQRIKKANNYSEAIGQDLNIIAPDHFVDPDTLMPVLKAKLDAGRPHLKWERGIAEAIDLYADHNDGKGFVLIGRFLRAEFLDTTPLAIGKLIDDFKYKGIYVIADEQVGHISQMLTVKVFKE